MNVSAASITALQNAQLQQQVSIATLSKAQDTMKAQGEAAVALLDTALEIAEATAQKAKAGVDVVA